MVRVFSAGDNQFDESGNYKDKNFRLNDKEVEVLNWFVNNIDINNYKAEITDYCNEKYSMWSDTKIIEQDLESEINITCIAINIT